MEFHKKNTKNKLYNFPDPDFDMVHKKTDITQRYRVLSILTA